MKAKSFLISVFFLFLLVECALSQKHQYVKGFYINHQGDTVSGYFIENKNNLFANLKFTDSIQNQVFTNISFDTCKAISVENDFYAIWYGRRCMTYVDKFDYRIINIDNFKTESIPIKLIYKGNLLSLYYYHDDLDHFFIGADTSIAELAISYRYLTDWEKTNRVGNLPSFFITPHYRNQIINAMGENLTKKKMRYIESSGYNLDDLKKLFIKLDKLPSKQ